MSNVLSFSPSLPTMWWKGVPRRRGFSMCREMVKNHKVPAGWGLFPSIYINHTHTHGPVKNGGKTYKEPLSLSLSFSHFFFFLLLVRIYDRLFLAWLFTLDRAAAAKRPFFFFLFLLLLNKKKGGKCRHWVQLQRHIMAVETIYTVLEAK